MSVVFYCLLGPVIVKLYELGTVHLEMVAVEAPGEGHQFPFLFLRRFGDVRVVFTDISV